jgi:arylsulfatase A-like enzyme
MSSPLFARLRPLTAPSLALAFAISLAGCPSQGSDPGEDPAEVSSEASEDGGGDAFSRSASDVGDRLLRDDTREPPAERPNILLIAFDNVRADRMSSYGAPRETTPVLDALAGRGTRFGHVIAQAPYTPHSFSSMFSSLHVADLPVRTRAQAKNQEPIDRAGLEAYHVTLPEALSDAGYATGGLLQGWFTDAFGLTQGFDWAPYKPRKVPDANRDAIRWLESWKQRGSDQPFFLFHYSFDVHYKFMKSRSGDDHVFGGDPEGFNFTSASLRDFRNGSSTPSAADLDNVLTLYDEGLYWADRDLGELFDALEEMDLARSTIVVFVSDHGEEFDEHGYLSHGQSNFRSVVDVPLLVFDPRNTASHGRVVETPVMNIDIMPTILDLAGVPIPETARGLSLVPSMTGDAQPELETRYLVSEGAWNGFVGSVTAGRYTFLLDDEGEPHLYDWRSDPDETQNLAASMPDLARRLEQVLFLHKRQGLANQLLLALGGTVELDALRLPSADGLRSMGLGAGTSDSTLTEEAEEQLRSLGYLQ